MSPATTSKRAQAITKRPRTDAGHPAHTNLSFAATSPRKNHVLKGIHASTATRESKSSTTQISTGPSSVLPAMAASVNMETTAPLLTLRTKLRSTLSINSTQMSIFTSSTIRLFGVLTRRPTIKSKIVFMLTLGTISAARLTSICTLSYRVLNGNRTNQSQFTKMVARTV